MTTYVLAIDNKLYKNPVIYGDGWYICFDDDELPELIVKVEKFTDCTALKTVIGLPFNYVSKGTKMHRIYPTDWIKMLRSICFYIELEKPIPIPKIHSGCVNDILFDQGTVYFPKGK